MNLLSVDWDFFFPEGEMNPETNPYWQLWDWGHKESRLFIDLAWSIRAADFLHHGLPLPQTSGEETNFWGRFRFAPDCQLFYAESHACAALPVVEKQVKRVISFDAHHDNGYGMLSKVLPPLCKGHIQCDDWLLYYKLTGRKTSVVYPRWKNWAFMAEAEPASPVDRRFDTKSRKFPIFDRIFVCRSGAWVPSWCDNKYNQFLAACPARTKTQVGVVVERVFDLEQVKRQMAAEELLRRPV